MSLRSQIRTPNPPHLATDSMKTPRRSILATRSRNIPGEHHVKFTLDSPDNSRLWRSHASSISDQNVRPIPRPLLGYDWIAGVVEMDSLPTSSKHGVDLAQDFINEMDEFRKTNREDCSRKVEAVGEQQFTPIKLRKRYPISPDPADLQDPRIFDYTVNSRLFPVAIDDSIQVRPGTKTSPRFIRISVPKAVLTTPTKYKRAAPKFTNFDSMSIRDHCAPGNQYALPMKDRVPKSKLTSHLDLKASLLPDPTKRVRDVGALHSTILSMPHSYSGSYRDPKSLFS